MPTITIDQPCPESAIKHPRGHKCPPYATPPYPRKSHLQPPPHTHPNPPRIYTCVHITTERVFVLAKMLHKRLSIPVAQICVLIQNLFAIVWHHSWIIETGIGLSDL